MSAYGHEKFLGMTEMLGLYIMIQWTRIIFLFKVNSFVGPMLNIIQNMLYDVLKFIFIYLLILVIFAAAGRLMFNQIDQFNSDKDTFTYLISASFGEFEFDKFDSKAMTVSKNFGYIYLITYLIISNIVLLNFVIAILSSTYSRLISVSKALYLNEIVKARNIFEFNHYFSSLISLPIPLNGILLPFYPFIVYLKSKKLNKFLLHISYLPVMLLGTLLFIIMSLLLYPISYLALLYQNFIDIWEKGGNGSNRCIEITQFFTMIFTAPFLLFGLILKDLYNFIRSLYTKDIRIHNEKALFRKLDLSNIDQKYFDVLKEILYEKKGRLMDVKKLIRIFNDRLNVNQNIHNIIYCSHKEDTNKEDFDDFD